MMLGMSLSTFTFVHVLLSLAGIGTGFVVFFGLLGSRRLDGWTAIFLTTTVATSVTGFGFPADHFLPSHAVGTLSLVVLTAAIVARYSFRLAGAWRRVYVIGATVALYFNVFVGVVQAFRKIPALHGLAPTQSEPAFVIAQSLVLAVFVGLGILAGKRFQIETMLTA